LTLHFKDDYVTKYKLTEIAGIRRTMGPEVEGFVEKLIEKHNAFDPTDKA
jgi:hypothetical protein